MTSLICSCMSTNRKFTTTATTVLVPALHHHHYDQPSPQSLPSLPPDRATLISPRFTTTTRVSGNQHCLHHQHYHHNHNFTTTFLYHWDHPQPILVIRYHYNTAYHNPTCATTSLNNQYDQLWSLLPPQTLPLPRALITSTSITTAAVTTSTNHNHYCHHHNHVGNQSRRKKL